MSKRFENILRQIVRFSLGSVACLSFFYVLGTVGALDLDMVDLGTGAIRCLGGCGVFAFSTWLLG